MNPRSFYKLFGVTLLAFVCAVALWVMAPTYQPDKGFGQKFIPNLIEKINNVAVMSIEHAGTTTTFERDNAGNWSLVEAANYPADKERIRNVLIGLANLEKVEPKTALPEYYKDLGVENNTAEDAQSYLLTLMGNDGREIARLLVGKKTGGVRWDGQGYFVRVPQQSQSWLVRGLMDITGDTKSWLNTRLLPIQEYDISAITFVDQTKTREFAFRRQNAGEALTPTFGTDRYFLKSEEFVDGMVKALSSLDFTDVGRRPENLGQIEPHASLFIETDNAMNVFVFLYVMDKKPYVAISFRAEPNASEQVQDLAKRLESRHAPWLYQIHGTKVSAILPFLPSPHKKVKPDNGEKSENPAKKATKHIKKK